MCHAMPCSSHATLALSIVLSTTIHVITVVKICCGLTWLRLASPQHFDHCDDAYLSIRVQTTLNHIRFVSSKTVRETATSPLARAPLSFLFKGGTTWRSEKTYGVDLSELLRKCVYRLCKGVVKLPSALSNCFQVEPFFGSQLIPQSFSIAL